MSNLLNKVNTLPSICGIELATAGTMLPSAIEGYQRFANAIPQDTDFAAAYFGRASVTFSEESVSGRPGTSFKQKLIIQFPVSDSRRSERLALMHRVKYIKVRLSNGRDLLIGRNDFEQNTAPLITTRTDERLGQAEFETFSIFPTGYTPAFDAAGMPEIFPISFIPD
jgi:hypothetical protein